MGLFWVMVGIFGRWRVVMGLFWKVEGDGGFILGGDGLILRNGGWWWVYFGWLWMVIDIF